VVGVTVVETRLSVWEALAGSAPGRTAGPADPGLWAAVAERLNPARARPRLRKGIEDAQLTSVRGVDYVMLRSPDGVAACYLRLTPDELALARLMDGSRTVARLVAEFAKISGRLAPDQVTRVVADLAGNRMLEELPVDAFRRLDRVHRRPWPARVGRAALAFARGRRLVVARIDPMITLLYRAGGRLIFTRVAAVLLGLVALAGLGIFAWTWILGSQPVFLAGGSYALGAAVLLGLNVLALACHELGHALATKHVGRRVPAAGFLVYFGIPSVFVDTTDVWMAGRRARLLTTAAGPATGLVLAGVAQLVGVLDPALAPWCFKLSFAWYVNVGFNLNPFLALDGYYLLMDWLEVPNLRARGLAWVIARLRRRPPAFGTLDREGRLVALYGMLSVIWLIIAGNLAYRVYVDRVGGLVTGLWEAGWARRILLFVVVAGLAAPAVFALLSWLGRRWRRARARVAERRVAADAPRRYDALRSSALGRLPADALGRLAADARWVRPRTGEQLVFAGAAQPAVFVVVDGALEGRRPGDPSGTVRQRVGAGGVVGLANALTGAASALAWHTAGTTLLAVPTATVAAAVGPLPAPPAGDRAELETLFDTAPALAGLSVEDRLGLAARSRLVTVPPDGTLELPGEGDAAVVAAGMMVGPDGAELGSGALIGPLGGAPVGAVARARSHVRAWILPALGGLPLPLGTGSPGGPADPGQAPAFGAHPPSGYPPLAAPPGPPPAVPEDVDRRFERRLWWLLILLLLLALLLTGLNLLPGPAWSEMPEDHALLHVDRGTVTATVDGTARVLHRGDDAYVSSTDRIVVADRADGRLTFRGGGYAVLCGGSRLLVGPLSSAGRPVAPAGALELTAGKLLAYTAGTSPAFRPLALRVSADGRETANDGAARYSVGWDGVDASAGLVTRDGAELRTTGDRLSCGDEALAPLPTGPGSPTFPDSPSPSDPLSPSASSSASASPSPSAGSTTGIPATPGAPPATGGPATPGRPPTTPGRPPTTAPTTRPATSPSPTRSSSPPPPPDQPPTVVRGPVTNTSAIYRGDCEYGQPRTSTITIYVSDPDDAAQDLKVSGTWSVAGSSGSFGLKFVSGEAFQGTFGPVTANIEKDTPITVSVKVTDPGGKSASGTTSVTLYAVCQIG
jgi:putative peptide zinc metalloprotease protein